MSSIMANILTELLAGDYPRKSWGSTEFIQDLANGPVPPGQPFKLSSCAVGDLDAPDH
jgi:hypothetical protein